MKTTASTGAFTWTPTEAQGPGSYPFIVRVSDGVTNTDAAITDSTSAEGSYTTPSVASVSVIEWASK